MMLAAVATSWLSFSAYSTLPFWPLLGAVLTGLLIALRVKPERTHWPVVLGVAVTAALGVMLYFDLSRAYEHEPVAAETPVVVEHAAADAHAPAAEHAADGAYHDYGHVRSLYRWISFGAGESLTANHWVAVNFYFDALTATMLLFFTVVSLMVVIYAVGYMRDHHGHPEAGYGRFFAFLGLFVFSMGMLVLSGNFVLLYLGWEAVGLCSYLLIGFYFRKPEAAAAAKKAFIVNRIGDLGFALAIFAIFMYIRPLVAPGENPLDFAVVFKYFGAIAHDPSGFFGFDKATLVGLLLMCGAVGKSAQFPLYVWLPDAMEGPTPVSALIHAATMVTAGIYMIARCSPIYMYSPLALNVILTIGVIGAFLTATMAMAQYDMKRILAYSTISQLAYMFVALGCAVPDSAVFHVFTHAWFKALLFLGAGSVMHQMGGIIDIRRFSGLRHVLPQTYAVMWFGCLALSGFPLLAGFWSKDEIVHAAFVANPAVGIIMMVVAFMTAYYTFRMFFMAFHGKLKLPDEAGEHPHESPAVMILPLVVLAMGAVFTGYLGVQFLGGEPSERFLGIFKPHGAFHHFLHYSTIHKGLELHGDLWLAYLSGGIAIAGIALAWLRYGSAPEVDPDAKLLGPIFTLWNRKYWVDELYDRAIVRPLRGLGSVFFGTDRFGVDGLVWFVSAVPRGIGFLLHFLQRGAVQGYAVSMALGVAALLLLWYWL